MEYMCKQKKKESVKGVCRPSIVFLVISLTRLGYGPGQTYFNILKIQTFELADTIDGYHRCYCAGFTYQPA